MKDRPELPVGKLLYSSLGDVKRHWAGLLGGVLLFDLVAAGVLAPLTTGMLKLLVHFSGREVLADTDILMFLLSPWGWLALLLVGAALLTTTVMHQATLLNLLAAPDEPRPLASALLATLLDTKAVFLVAARVVGRALLWSLPSLGVIALAYLALLTRYDINYYMSVQPWQWWAALAIGALAVLGWLVLIVPRLLAWYLAFPLVMFGHTPPGQALSESARLMRGRRRQWLTVLVGWLAASSVAAAVLTAAIALAGHVLLDRPHVTLGQAVLSVGMLAMLWGTAHLLLTLLAAAWHAALWYRLSESAAIVERGTPADRTSKRWQQLAGRQLEAVLERIPWAMVAVGGVAVLAILAGGWIATRIAIPDRATVTAHRGASAEAPENTLAAFRLAIEQRADWVELDVQLTADNQVVVFHDRDLKKVSGVDLVIEKATLAQLRQVDIGRRAGESYRGERIPTLAEALEVCRGKVGVNIELKFYGRSEGLEQRVVEVVQEYGEGMPLVFMSLKADAVRKLKRLKPQWKVGLLTAVVVGDLTRLPADFYAVSADLADPPLIDRIHSQGKEVYVWTVNDPISLSRMAGRGVDSLITDYPARAKRVLRTRAELSPAQRLLLELAPLFGVAPRFEDAPEDA